MVKLTIDMTIPSPPPPIPIPSLKNNSKIYIILFSLLTTASLAISVFLYYQNQQLKQNITQPEVQPTQTEPQPTTDPSTDWKTIIFTNYGFSMKIPEGWTVSNDSMDGQLIILTGDITTIDDARNLLHIQKISDPSLFIDFAMDQGIPAGIIHSGESQEISQILSTFKFVNQSVTPSITVDTSDINPFDNWTTYTDVNYPFQIKHPEDWQLRTTYGQSVNNLNNDRVAGIDVSNSLTYGSTVAINVIDPKGKTLEDWVKTDSGYPISTESTNSTYNGYPAFRFESSREGRPNNVVIYYQYKDKIIFVAWNPASFGDLPTIDNILSTFKFTP